MHEQPLANQCATATAGIPKRSERAVRRGFQQKMYCCGGKCFPQRGGNDMRSVAAPVQPLAGCVDTHLNDVTLDSNVQFLLSDSRRAVCAVGTTGNALWGLAGGGSSEGTFDDGPRVVESRLVARCRNLKSGAGGAIRVPGESIQACFELGEALGLKGAKSNSNRFSQSTESVNLPQYVDATGAFDAARHHLARDAALLQFREEERLEARTNRDEVLVARCSNGHGCVIETK